MSNLVFFFVLFLVPGSAANISTNNSYIPMLNGTNFKSWKENVLIVLRVMDLDLALQVDQPDPLTHETTSDQKREMEKWERSNRMSLMIMKLQKLFEALCLNRLLRLRVFLRILRKGCQKWKG